MKALRLFAAAALVITFAGLAQAQAISEKSKSFLVTYPDGSKETVLVKYQGFVDASQQQQGSASKPFEGHPIDDRHCTWSIKTYVLRSVYFVSKSGQQGQIGSMTHTFDDRIDNSRGPSNIIQATGYHVTCGQVQNQIDAQETAAKSKLEAGFDQIVDSDSATVEKDLKDLLHPVSLDPN
jgi:hypothetical protein